MFHALDKLLSRKVAPNNLSSSTGKVTWLCRSLTGEVIRVQRAVLHAQGTFSALHCGRGPKLSGAYAWILSHTMLFVFYTMLKLLLTEAKNNVSSNFLCLLSKDSSHSTNFIFIRTQFGAVWSLFLSTKTSPWRRPPRTSPQPVESSSGPASSVVGRRGLQGPWRGAHPLERACLACHDPDNYRPISYTLPPSHFPLFPSARPLRHLSSPDAAPPPPAPSGPAGQPAPARRPPAHFVSRLVGTHEKNVVTFMSVKQKQVFLCSPFVPKR